MIGMTVTTTDSTHKVKAAADRATYENIRHAAFSIAKAARASITKSADPSTSGKPPRTRAGPRGIRRAIRVGMEGRDAAVVGTMHSAFGPAGEILEHGGRRGDTFMEPRPFMAPALEDNLDRFANSFRGAIGE